MKASIFSIIFTGAFLCIHDSSAFSLSTSGVTPINGGPIKTHEESLSRAAPLGATAVMVDSSPSTSSSISKGTYEHDGWKLSYRYKPATPGYENESPVLLIHPVGVGLSSWFFEKIMETWTGSAIYAVDLIGCGYLHGGDAWNPEERGLSFPLGWAKGCEALINSKILPEARRARQKIPFIDVGPSPKCTVVVQGGLAPVGVVLAARKPDIVDKLIMTSPPQWKEMTTAVPQSELDFNYNFLRSPLLGKFAFNVLETRAAVDFFSNLFLFSKKCDNLWLQYTMKEACEEVRPPIQAFNAGFCNHRSFEEELQTLTQPTLILQGNDDKKNRSQYLMQMKNCKIEKLPGLNVLPWESPEEVCNSIRKF